VEKLTDCVANVYCARKSQAKSQTAREHLARACKINGGIKKQAMYVEHCT